MCKIRHALITLVKGVLSEIWEAASNTAINVLKENRLNVWMQHFSAAQNIATRSLDKWLSETTGSYNTHK